MMAHVRQTAGGGRVAAFSAVSLLGFCVQLAAFAALTRARCPYLPATALAVEVAVLHNFAWHCCWTWRDRVAGSDAWVRRLAAFNLTTGVSSLAGNVLGMTILVGVFELPPLAAITASVLCTSVANFTVSNRWVFRPAAMLAIVAIGPAAPVAARAEGPGPETIAAWNLHVARTEARLASAAAGWLSPAQRAPVLAGAALVLEGPPPGADPQVEVPGGTLQHWRGAIFVAGADVDALVNAVRLTAPVQDGVVRSRVLSTTADGASVYLRLVYQKVLTVTYDTWHESRFERQGEGVWTSRSVMTDVREVESPGTNRERWRRPGEDRGFLWRLHSYARYSSVPGGVVVEIESLTLSRQVPLLARPLAAPIVGSLAREAMLRALQGIARRAGGVRS
jgi:putative flippase GtrA